MTLFHETWWLDAVAPGAWNAVTEAENGTVVGRLPFFESRRFGQRVLGMPPLTRTLGPLVARGGGKAHTERQRDARIVGALIGRLPPHVFFKQHLPPDCNPLPFQFHGFSLSSESVFVVDCRRGSTQVWQDLPSRTRTMIRQSGDRYEAVKCTDVEAFIRFHTANLAASGRSNHFPADVVARVHAACLAHAAGRILAARDRSGQLAAAIFVAWSKGRMHFLLLTRTATAKNGAVEFLVWHAATLACELGLIFDLDGIPNEVAARRMAQFGGAIEQRAVVTGGKWFLPSLRHLRREIRWTLGCRDGFV